MRKVALTTDLFKIARQNAESICRRYQIVEGECKARGEAQLLETFTAFVKKNRSLSINLKQWDASSFLTSGIYKNLYQVINDDLKKLKRERNLDIS